MVELVLDSQIESSGERITTLRLSVDPDLVDVLRQLGLSLLVCPTTPQQWLFKAQQGYVPAGVEAQAWQQALNTLLAQDLPPEALAWAVRPWASVDVFITLGNAKPLYKLRSSDRLGRLIRQIEEVVENNVPMPVKLGKWHLPGLDYHARQRSSLQDIWASLCFLTGRQVEQGYRCDPFLLLAAEHLAVAIGRSWLSRVPGWQTLDFFWRQETHPYCEAEC